MIPASIMVSAAMAHVARTGETLGEIFDRARRQSIPPELAVDRIAETRFRRQTNIAA